MLITAEEQILLEPGVAVYNPPGVKHRIVNTRDKVLRFVWIYAPQLPTHRIGG